ncbi:hypothetical protein SMAC4_13202 [Sordaria macrospora]|uniref:uncharacterized protein n=1 Tax=Sordaria macrospora TaxID=5147 RepID=UPI002B2AF206|nr:hypothetical protein SMAC4_13202 [Sordaria macrospora]
MCKEHIFVTRCWHCNCAHGAVKTEHEKCQRAESQNLRWGGCGYTSKVDRVLYASCHWCTRYRRFGAR